MMKMFKNFKEMRQLKKLKLQLEVDLLGKLYNFTEELGVANESGISMEEAINAIKKLQSIDQKDLARELVKDIKKN